MKDYALPNPEEPIEFEIGELVYFQDDDDIAKSMRCLYSQYAGKLATIVWKKEWYPGTKLFRYKVIVDGDVAPEVIWSGALKKIS